MSFLQAILAAILALALAGAICDGVALRWAQLRERRRLDRKVVR